MSPRRAGVVEHGPGRVGIVACLLLVAASAAQVCFGHVLAVDRGVRSWSATHQEPQVFAALDAVTRLARWQWVCVSLIIIAGTAAIARRTLRPLTLALLSVFFLVVVTWVLKAVVGRPGPTGVAPPAHDGAWPSGHAVAMVVATVVILRLFPALRAAHPPGLAVAFLPAAFVGAALIYCGHHWFTDVAVAFPLGLLLGWAALWVAQWGSRRRPFEGGGPGAHVGGMRAPVDAQRGNGHRPGEAAARDSTPDRSFPANERRMTHETWRSRP
jgi:membrane-associated phospholipid phosphatase